MDLDNFLKFKNVYNAKQENDILQEFARLSENCYLDHAGATLYSETQLKDVFSDLSQNIYANPHAQNVSSKSTEDAVDIIRYQLLEHFNTNNEEYSVIFTFNATAALKIVGECFLYGKEEKGTMAYLENNHTSVLGMRNYAENILEIKTVDAFEVLSGTKKRFSSEKSAGNNSNSLFIYPAECNFSGTKYPLDWIERVHEGCLNDLSSSKSRNWYVLLDCACYVSTNSLDLTLYKPDFIPISFYKMFGYPTGLGALLVRKSSEEMLLKKYFGGGTLQMALSSRNVMVPRTVLHERFEDGTLPFLSVLAIKHGFNTMRRLNLNFDLISEHTFSLAQFIYRHLVTLHHSNGQPVVILYHDTTFDNEKHQGGIVNFNLLRATGDFVGYSEVLHMANLHGIHLRTGCFCNPGACQRFLKLQSEDVFQHFKAGHQCGDQYDLIDGYPTGSVRISFGYMSSLKDARTFLDMIENCFVVSPLIRKLPYDWRELNENYSSLFSPTSKIKLIPVDNYKTFIPKDIFTESQTNSENKYTGTLQQIFLYPIKSCGAFKVENNWKLTGKGLKYDREWMITNSSGVCVTQKHNKKLCLITPYIDLEKNTMKLKFIGRSSIEISLDISAKEYSASLCQGKVCGDRVVGWDCGDDVADWLSTSLDTPGLRLLRQYTDKNMQDSTRKLSFVNKAEYLLINSASVEWLIDKIPSDSLSEDVNSVIKRFRPNFVINLKQPFKEEHINKFLLNGLYFKSTGKCTRCQMICVNQETGKATKEPLLTLSKEMKGKISFGIYLKQEHVEEQSTITDKHSLEIGNTT